MLINRPGLIFSSTFYLGRSLSLLECSASDVLPYTLSIIIVNVKVRMDI